MPQEPTRQGTTNADLLGDLFEQSRTRHTLIARILLFVIGGALVVYGVVGVILPVLPGFPFLVVGMPLLAASNERSRGWVNALDRRFPLAMRLLLRRFKLSLPPKDASLEERKRWRSGLYLTLLMWLACGLVFGGLAVLMRWLWVAYVAPML